MEAKKLLKKHLDIHIPKGKYRSEKQLIQLRYDASIDAINEALTIHSVSQQRELLLAYEKHTSFKCLGKETPNISKDMVEDFLANNCG